MQPTDDSALLRQYAENNSDEAFAALVTRHINLVYSVAMRRVGNPASAEEITQAVFIILARKAGQLRHDKALSSWLFQVTRLTANNFIRSEARRHRREEEAYMQSVLNEAGTDVWPKIAPLLDDAVAGLREQDRQAIVLRFYEGRNLREVGLALGASEAAAEKRVNRAVEKLRKFFSKRGVMFSCVAITGAISANAVQAAPMALAKSVTAMAIAKGAAASGSTLILVKGTLKILTYAKLKLTTGVAAGILLAGGAVTVVLSSHQMGDNLSPDEIFNKVKGKYVSLTSYSDEGKTVATMNGSTGTTTFTIRLGRPNLYRIEWEQNNGTTFSTAKTQVVWSAGAGDYFTMGFGERIRTSLEMALNGAPSISSSAATTIPAVFFKMGLGNQLGGPPSGEKRQADEKVGDVDCYVLASELNGTTKTLWIGKQDFLIHQIRTATSAITGKVALPPLAAPANIRLGTITALEKAGFPGITSTETHMNIVINQSLSKADFDYQASTALPR